MFLKKEFYFLRHGQTDVNKTGSTTDHSDISLNEHGRLQAREIESVIKSLPIKTVCCSPLKRAKETKEIVTASLDVPHCEIMDLTECNWKIWFAMTKLGLEARHSQEDPVFSFMQQVQRGINSALSQEGPVLIVAHGGIHWAMCCLMNVAHEWVIENCGAVHFTVEKNGSWNARKLGFPRQ